MQRRELGGFESAQAWTGASFPYNAVTVLRLVGVQRVEDLLAADRQIQQALARASAS